jgi:hypothetical protein
MGVNDLGWQPEPVAERLAALLRDEHGAHGKRR